MQYTAQLSKGKNCGILHMRFGLIQTQERGYLARANDAPPGNTVMWRGVSRLTDIELCYELAKNCG